MAQEIRDIVFNIQVRTEDGKVKIDGLTKGFVNAETAFKRMKTALDQTNDAMKGAGISTGLANTAVLEFGRTISDAPYGIQGMGNNITQLVTIFGQMSEAAKEGESALKAFGKAMRGPLGVILVVQTAIAAFEMYSRSQREAKKETKTYIGILSDLRTEVVKLEILAEVMNSNSASAKTQQDALAALKKNGYDPLTQSVEEFIEAQRKLALSKAAYELYAKSIATLEKERLELLDESRDTMADFFKFQQEGDPMVEILRPQVKVIKERLAEINQSLDKEKGRMKKIFEDEDLVSFLFGGSKGKDKAKRKEKVKGVVTEIYDTTFAQAEDRKKYGERMLERLGISDIPSLLIGGEEGKKKLGEGILGLVEGLEDTGYSDRIKEILRKYVGEEAILEGFNTMLDATSGLLQAQADRDLAIETNKTNALNDQLKARLANEQLSATERDKINQQIARNEAELVKKENEINKKRFEQQKALQLASATAELYRTAFLAYGSQLVIGDPTSPIRAQIAQGVALAAGLANIAMIAKQKFVGKAMPTASLTAQTAGGPAESQSPAFNIVGASGQSQLAQLISGQTNQPIKAYVVAGEVSTAQSLERNRIAEASI